jgi:hypothetical protein
MPCALNASRPTADLRKREILVVADREFRQLILHGGIAHAGVLFFRLPGARLQTKIEHLNQALQQANSLAAGEFVIMAPGNIRVAGRAGS